MKKQPTSKTTSMKVSNSGKSTPKTKSMKVLTKSTTPKTKPMKVLTKSTTSKPQGLLTFNAGQRESLNYGKSKVYTQWGKDGKGRYRVYKKPGDKVESSFGFSSLAGAKTAWRLVAKMLRSLNPTI